MDLSKREEEVLSVVREHVSRYGIAPSLAETGEAVGISAEGVRLVLLSLEEKGIIRREKGRKRFILLTRSAAEGLMNTLVPLFDSEPSQGETRSIRTGKTIPIERELYDGSILAYIVRSESFVEGGILPGDIAFVSLRRRPKDNDIVLADLSDGPELRRFRRLPGYIELIPENSSMDIKKLDITSVRGVLIKTERRYPQ